MVTCSFLYFLITWEFKTINKMTPSQNISPYAVLITSAAISALGGHFISSLCTDNTTIKIISTVATSVFTIYHLFAAFRNELERQIIEKCLYE